MTHAANASSHIRLDRIYRSSDSIVPLARSVIAEQARAWHLPTDMTDRAVGVCSELVTNAVGMTSADDHIKIRFEWFPTCVLLSVWDGSSQAPQRRPPDLRVPHGTDPATVLTALDVLTDTGPGDLPVLGGWGLNVVETLADAVGAYWPTPIPAAGKWIWARFVL